MTNARLRVWVADPARTRAHLDDVRVALALPDVAGESDTALRTRLEATLAALPQNAYAAYSPRVSWLEKAVTAFLGMQLVADALWFLLLPPMLGFPWKRELSLAVIGFSMLASIAAIVYGMLQQPLGRRTRRTIMGMILGGIFGASLELVAIIVIVTALLSGWSLAVPLFFLWALSTSADMTVTIKHINAT